MTLKQIEAPKRRRVSLVFLRRRNLDQSEGINQRNDRWLSAADSTEAPTVMHANEVSIEKEVKKHPHNTKSSLVEAIARATEGSNKDHLIKVVVSRFWTRIE
ncbi:hypothetical protein ACTXT7_007601 [Hymenolepis weldensis]